MSKKRWLKMGYTCEGTYGIATVHAESNSFMDAKKAVEEHFEGCYPLQIDDMEAGACLDQQLTAEEAAYFIDKKYNY